MNQAIEGVLRNNQKARQNPKALAQLDGYNRELVNSLTENLQRFGFEKNREDRNSSGDHRGKGQGADSRDCKH